MNSKRLVLYLALLIGLTSFAACANQAVFVTLPPPTAAPVTRPPVNNPLPLSLDDINETQVYRFRVDPAQTNVEYAVQELLRGDSVNTRGRTNAVEGEFQLYMDKGQVYIALSNLQVDLRTLSTDNPLRDQAIRKQWLESDKYPMAIFVADSVEGLAADAVQNQPYKFQVTGDMTIRNITRRATFDVTATVRGDQIVGEGTTIIHMRDFGFEPPNIVGTTLVSDPATISVQGVAYLVPE
jgi:polyisoprenoid-binding protein YceI